MFQEHESDEVIRLARELLPASLTAAAYLVATDTGGIVRDPAGFVVDIAGHISRNMAKQYLDSARAARRSEDIMFFLEEQEEFPPYGEFRVRGQSNDSGDADDDGNEDVGAEGDSGLPGRR